MIGPRFSVGDCVRTQYGDGIIDDVIKGPKGVSWVYHVKLENLHRFDGFDIQFKAIWQTETTLVFVPAVDLLAGLVTDGGDT